MSNKQKTSDEKLIQSIAELLGTPDKKELQQDIEDGLKSNSTTKFAKEFINKYSKSKLNESTCQEMLNKIISKLINLREDFIPLMKIYKITKDEEKSKILKNHFVLQDKKLTKIENGSTDSEELPYLKFGVNLSCTYSKDSYYHKFIKGILLYIKLNFKEKYLNEFISQGYYADIDKSKFYIDNDSDMCYLINRMLNDIYRILCEQSDTDLNENKNKIIPKIMKNKYQLLRIKAHLQKNVEILDIYEQCKNNDEILKALDNLLSKNENDHELQVNIVDFKEKIENYLKSEKKDIEFEKYISKQNEELFLTQKQINNYKDQFNQKFDNIEKKYNNLNIKYNDLNKQNNDLNIKCDNLTNQNNVLNTLYNNLSQENNDLKAKYNNLSQEKNDLNTKYNNLNTQVTELKEKVEFMEPIVFSLICRKVLNYSIIKILEKYKKNIKVTLKRNSNNEISYDIRFCSPVNNIDIVTLNLWMNNLFFRKDGFNSNSHLVNKDLPSFIPNIWEKVKASLNLDSAGAAIFDSLISEDIKSGFNFK